MSTGPILPPVEPAAAEMELDQAALHVEAIQLVQTKIRELHSCRELALVQTKLDEARFWLYEYQLKKYS